MGERPVCELWEDRLIELRMDNAEREIMIPRQNANDAALYFFSFPRALHL